MDRKKLATLVMSTTGAASQQSGKRREIYHNALPLRDASSGNLAAGELQLFNNKWLDYRNGTRR